MAQLKSLIVNGASRFIGDVFANTFTGNLSGNATTATTATNAGNADTVDGLHVHSGRNYESNKIVRTDGNGYIQCGYINSSSGDEGNNASPTKVWGTNGSDSYMRTYLTSALSVGSASYATYLGNSSSYYSYDSLGTTFLKLTGGSMSGTINTAYNAVGINFRGGSAPIWDSWCAHETAGAEALVFGTQTATTSFMFANGISYSNVSSSQFSSLTPGLTIQNNRVAINKPYVAAGPSYTFEVYGSTKHEGEIQTNGRIYSEFASGTWINSASNAVITCNYSGYGGIFCAPVNGGRIAVTTYPASDGDLHFLYFSSAQISSGGNSYTTSMVWDGASNALYAGSFRGNLDWSYVTNKPFNTTVFLTASEYSALSTKDSNTIYFIKE